MRAFSLVLLFVFVGSFCGALLANESLRAESVPVCCVHSSVSFLRCLSDPSHLSEAVETGHPQVEVGTALSKILLPKGIGSAL